MRLGMVLDIEIVGKVKRMKKLNQELYDLLFDDIGYIIEYSKKYGVPMPKREIKLMTERIHFHMDQIEPYWNTNNGIKQLER
jgi:hypothetical protein